MSISRAGNGAGLIVKKSLQRTCEKGGRRVLSLDKTNESAGVGVGGDVDGTRRRTRGKEPRKLTTLERRAERYSKIIRFFRTFDLNQKTVSVFGMSRSSPDEVRIVQACAKFLFGEVFCLGVCEAAETGTHAHILMFRNVGGVPTPLTQLEERKICELSQVYLLKWRGLSSADKEPYVCRWVKKMERQGLYDLAPEGQYTRLAVQNKLILYRVPRVVNRQTKRSYPSGLGYFAVGYVLKTLTSPKHQKNFVSSLGAGPILKMIKDTEDTKVKHRQVWNGPKDSEFRYDLLSIAAYEICKYLHDGVPVDKISVYFRYGKVISCTSNRLKTINNHYLLCGLEMLRRNLVAFSGPSELRRAVVKATSAMCPQLRKFSDEQMWGIIHEVKRRINMQRTKIEMEKLK